MHLKESLEKIYNNKKNLENSFQSGKLTGKTYLASQFIFRSNFETIIWLIAEK